MSKNSLTVLAQKLAEKTGISQQDAELFIRKMFDVVNEGLQADKQVKMKWLGTFKVTSVKDRESVDVNTGERIVIEGRDKISFTPDTILKEIINKPFAQFETVVVNDGVEFDEIDRKFEAEEQLAENQQMDEAEEIPEPLDGSETSEETSEANGISEISDTSETSDTSEISDTSETSDVIDFLDESEAPSVSDKVVVIGESEPQYDASPEIITETIVEKSVKEMKDEDEPTLVPESTPEPTLEPTPEPEQISAPDSEPVVESACASDSETSEDSESYDTFESTEKGVVIPRYLVIVACFIIVALIGGIGWFAFNYGKMAAQRDHLALQLDNFHQGNKAAKPTPAPLSQEEIMRKKAIEDSIRMAQASEAVKMAEADGKQADKKDSLLAAKQQKDAEAKKLAELNKRADAKKLAEAKKVAEAKKADEAKKLQAEKAAAHASAKYDQDARVRTGAYRIVGVAEVVTAREGQTIEAISKRYFGPGMECYVEALNGSGKLKAGQKVKIPKLELKKKSRTP
ncbi:HU family DNA-binding protein [Segatella copri]|uniref:HU family DNA-binding protein n=1 Tax=Segatella copri TaxID=165179 RepID=UPI001EE4A503|nr:HU family DNA-binding protein [Segatella copri]